MADESKKTSQADADKAKAKAERRAAKAELREHHQRHTVKVEKGEGSSAVRVEMLNAHQKAKLEKQGRPIPKGPSEDEALRHWELHYLAAGQPVPNPADNEDLD